MLGGILRKIESGDLDLNPREIKVAVPYAAQIIRQKPELFDALLAAVPESQRLDHALAWLPNMLRPEQFSAPIIVDQGIPRRKTPKTPYDPAPVNRIIELCVSAGTEKELCRKLRNANTAALRGHLLSSSLDEVRILEDVLSQSDHGKHILGCVYYRGDYRSSHSTVAANPDVEAHFAQRSQEMWDADMREGGARAHMDQHQRHAMTRDSYPNLPEAQTFIEAARTGAIKDAKKLLKEAEEQSGKPEKRFFLRGSIPRNALVTAISSQNWAFGEWLLDEITKFGGENDLVRILNEANGSVVTARYGMDASLLTGDAFIPYLIGGAEERLSDDPNPALEWVLKQARERVGKGLVMTLAEKSISPLFHDAMRSRSGRERSGVRLDEAQSLLDMTRNHGGKKAARQLIVREQDEFDHLMARQSHPKMLALSTVGAPSDDRDTPDDTPQRQTLRILPDAAHASTEDYLKSLTWLLEQAETLGGEGTAKRILDNQALIFAEYVVRSQRADDNTAEVSKIREDKLFGVLDLCEQYGGKDFAKEVLQSLNGSKPPSRQVNQHPKTSRFLDLIFDYCAIGHAEDARRVLDRIEAVAGAEEREAVSGRLLERVNAQESNLSLGLQRIVRASRHLARAEHHELELESGVAPAIESLREVFGDDTMRHAFTESDMDVLYAVMFQIIIRRDGRDLSEGISQMRALCGDAYIDEQLSAFAATSERSALRNRHHLEESGVRTLFNQIKHSESGVDALRQFFDTQRPAPEPNPHYPNAPQRQRASRGKTALLSAMQAASNFIPLTCEIVHFLEGDAGLTRVVKELFEDDASQRTHRGQNQSREIGQLISTLASLGATGAIAAIDEAKIPKNMLRALRDESLNKHDLLQEIGSGEARWMAIFNKPAPAPALKNCSPLKFSAKVYEQMLPIMQLAARVERNQGAEMNAYKLAVMFSSAQEAERYLDRYVSEWGVDRRQPVHDALLFEMPKQGRWNPLLWKDLLLKHGPAVSKYMGLAPRIEAWIAQEGIEFPQSPAELKAAAANVAYERASENPELARLALGLGMGEPKFNAVLDEIATNHKERDHLPDIFIDGADIGHPNFYMEKLAIGDPRGLFLGELTNCCQSIGGAGAGCAKHGFSSEDGGFYVWKHKTKGHITPDDTIVAQSWVWRGEDNALVFDSFERLSSDYNALAKPFIQQFAHEVQSHTFPNAETGEPEALEKVRVGTSGNTPRMGFEKAENPSKPRGHQGYRDSNSQYQVEPLNQRREQQSAEVVELANWASREAERTAVTPPRAYGRG